MKRRLVVLLVVLMMAAVAVIPASANRGNGGLGVVYVTSQGLYYDTFVTAQALPPHGRFQILEPTDKEGALAETEFGPGDQGYVGGRWWADDGDGIMEDGELFLCPLLGPGRTTP